MVLRLITPIYRQWPGYDIITQGKSLTGNEPSAYRPQGEFTQEKVRAGRGWAALLSCYSRPHLRRKKSSTQKDAMNSASRYHLR